MTTSKIYFRTTEKFNEFCEIHNVKASVVDVGFGETTGVKIISGADTILAVLDETEFTNRPFIEQGE